MGVVQSVRAGEKGYESVILYLLQCKLLSPGTGCTGKGKPSRVNQQGPQCQSSKIQKIRDMVNTDISSPVLNTQIRLSSLPLLDPIFL